MHIVWTKYVTLDFIASSKMARHLFKRSPCYVFLITDFINVPAGMYIRYLVRARDTYFTCEEVPPGLRRNVAVLRDNTFNCRLYDSIMLCAKIGSSYLGEFCKSVAIRTTKNYFADIKATNLVVQM